MRFTEFPKTRIEARAMQLEKHMTAKDVAAYAVLLEDQRDQLAEALSSIAECWDGPLYKHKMLPLIQRGRAALKQLEEE